MADLFEQFTGNDWARYAAVVSKATCVASIGVAIVSMVFQFSFLIGFWTLFSGLVLAIWEFPFIFVLIPNFEKAKTFLMEDFKLKYEESKALLYFMLSIFCYWYSTPCMAAGILLDISSILFVCAAINRRTDAANGTQTNSNEKGLYSQTFCHVLSLFCRCIHTIILYKLDYVL